MRIIGPEHGTVGPELVKEAAKEAVQGIGYDLLIICGFAFDSHVAEEAKRYGKLTVLPTRINADLQMGEDFLKKTGSANLFMVFGEPDLEVKDTEDGKIEVEIKGLDIYDPTTGEIRSNKTDDIACWFIDTNYIMQNKENQPFSKRFGQLLSIILGILTDLVTLALSASIRFKTCTRSSSTATDGSTPSILALITSSSESW